MQSFRSILRSILVDATQSVSLLNICTLSVCDTELLEWRHMTGSLLQHQNIKAILTLALLWQNSNDPVTKSEMVYQCPAIATDCLLHTKGRFQKKKWGVYPIPYFFYFCFQESKVKLSFLSYQRLYKVLSDVKGTLQYEIFWLFTAYKSETIFPMAQCRDAKCRKFWPSHGAKKSKINSPLYPPGGGSPS